MGKWVAVSIQGMAEEIIPSKGLEELRKSQIWHFNLGQLKEELVCLFLSLKKYRCFPGTSCWLGFAASLPATPRCHYQPHSWERTLPKPRAGAKVSAFSWPGSFWEIQPALCVPSVWVGINWSSETTHPGQALTGTAPPPSPYHHTDHRQVNSLGYADSPWVTPSKERQPKVAGEETNRDL